MNEAQARDMASKALLTLLGSEQITFEELAKRLTQNGYKTTAVAVRNKIRRGSFSAGFLIAVSNALNHHVFLEKLPEPNDDSPPNTMPPIAITYQRAR